MRQRECGSRIHGSCRVGRVVLLLSLTVGLLSSPRIEGAAPAGTVDISCNNDRTVSVSVSATGTNLKKITAFVHRYATENDCLGNRNAELVTKVIDKSYSMGVNSASEQSGSLPCIDGKWYAASMQVEDWENETGDNRTACCQCRLVTGACNFGGGCDQLTPEECASRGGQYMGDGTECPGQSETAPTMSPIVTCGLLTLLLIIGVVALRKRRVL